MRPSSMTANRTTIARLRLRGGGPDALAAQLRLSHDLNRATVHPPALPPNAILCVRRLTSRAPATARQWEPALTATLTRCVQQAARPAHGPPPANAPAVIFADHAELLACLAQTWLAGGDPTQWWWQTLFATHDLTQTVITAWTDAPESVPAALEQLAHNGHAIRFVRALPAPAVATLRTRIIATFGLHALHTALNVPPAQDSPAPASQPAPPWSPMLADVNMRDLAREPTLLLGIALMQRRAPAALRSPTFAAQTAQWWQQAAPVDADLIVLPPSDAPPAPMHATHARDYLAPIAVDPPRPARRSPRAAAMPTAPALPEDEPLTPVDAPGDTPPLSAPPISIAQDAHAPVVTDGTSTQFIADDKLSPSRHTDAPPSNPPPPRAPIAPAPPLPRAPATTIATEFGGLFYLINVGIYLELYADFTTPLTPGLDLDIFDFMALVGAAWFGALLHDDPVWELLAELAGRATDEPPGAHFTPPDDQSLTAWLAALLATIETRLTAALDLHETRDVPHFLCAYPAEIAASATHLDIHLALADLPIELRLSGLDRNPGWVPAAGRIVTYYFD